MYLIRCNRYLCQRNGNSLNLFKHSTQYYSDDKKSSDNGNEDANHSSSSNDKTEKKQKSDKKSAKQEQSAAKSFSPETQTRLNELLKKLSSRSTLGIVKEVQTSKPLGYKNVRKVQRLDAKETKPKNVRDAAKAVSQELGDDNVEKDILSPYKTDPNDTDFLDNVISTMKTPAKRQRDSQTTQREPPFKADRAQQRDAPFKRPKPRLSQTISGSQPQERKPHGLENLNINLIGNEPIGIFDKIDQLQTKDDTLNTWNKLEKHELRLRMSTAPRNYFEKMAYWTEDGKIWHFPIDNEQGLDMEMQTPFTEHVFLEEYIESWCPQKGAVHNFMELICIALSKNPYLSVQQKREHLDWYRNYFDEKRDILQRIIEEKQTVATQVGDGETKEKTTSTTTAKISNS